MRGRDINTWATSLCFAKRIAGINWIGIRAAGTQTSTPIWDSGTPGDSLTYCTTMPTQKCSIFNKRKIVTNGLCKILHFIFSGVEGREYNVEYELFKDPASIGAFPHLWKQFIFIKFPALS